MKSKNTFSSEVKGEFEFRNKRLGKALVLTLWTESKLVVAWYKQGPPIFFLLGHAH